MRQTQNPEADSPAASGLYERFTSVDAQDRGDHVVDGVDYSRPEDHYTNWKGQDNSHIRWSFDGNDVDVSGQHDVVNVTSDGFTGGKRWSDAIKDGGKNLHIRRHPGNPQKTLIEPVGEADQQHVDRVLRYTNIDGTWNDDFGGVEVSSPITKDRLNDLKTARHAEDDKIFVGKKAITNGNVQGDAPPVRTTHIPEGGS